VLISAGVLPPGPRGEKRVVSRWRISLDEAHVRCRLEAVERFAAVYREGMTSRRFSWRRADGEAIDPRELILLSARQYDTRETWNRSSGEHHRWPAPLDPDRQLEWLPAQSLVNRREVHVPAAHVLLGYPEALEQGFTVPDSSGLAAHEGWEQALGNALLELIERDAVAIWWYNRLERPAVPVAGLPAGVGSYDRWAQSVGRRFWILDISTDLGVPVAAAISCSGDGRDLAMGFGAGWTFGAAAISSVGEIAQFDATRKLYRLDGEDTRHLVALARRLTIAQARWLAPHGEVPPPDAGLRTVDDLVARLAAAGLEAFAVPLAQSPAAVVRAVVPGLRPIWPRFAPGRLFEVPVLTGALEAPLAETVLNPDPILY
jgi:ribosomal protein S12 methylthiotransferase accessory factor